MNVTEFKVAVLRKGLTLVDVAKQANISRQSIYNRIEGRTEFKSSEIKTLAKLLDLSMSDVNKIFFDDGVN